MFGVEPPDEEVLAKLGMIYMDWVANYMDEVHAKEKA